MSGNGLDKTGLDNRLFEVFEDASIRRYVFMNNINTNVSRWSKNALEDFDGLDEYMEDAGAIWADHLHPDDRELFLQEMEMLFSGKKEFFDLDYRAKNKYGEYVMCTGKGKILADEQGNPEYFVGTIENHGIMDNIDAVTNLYNIYEFWNCIRKLNASGHDAIILLVGINNFSDINDNYSYAFGNKVLRAVANMLRRRIGGMESVYRMDGVQFALCLTDYSEEDVNRLYKELQKAARHDIYVGDTRIALSLSAGAVALDKEYDEFTIQTSARYAYTKSKHENHGELVFFEYSLLKDNKKNMEFMSAIRNSISNQCDGFYLCFQPIFDARDEKLIGAEALLRWCKEPYGEVPPGVFIPWIENDPLFWDLGNWILRQAMVEGKALLEKYPNFILNVNLAYPQLAHTDFVDKVKEIVEEVGYPTQNLCLELTERCRQLERDYLQNTVQQLKDYGIKIAIDDFGTGFSSLSLLSELPIDTLKIDRGFVCDIQTNESNQAIVKAVTGCAEDLNVHVCMEGLEDREMIDFVKRYDVYSYQGFYFSRPIPMDKFKEKYIM